MALMTYGFGTVVFGTMGSAGALSPFGSIGTESAVGGAEGPALSVYEMVPPDSQWRGLPEMPEIGRFVPQIFRPATQGSWDSSDGLRAFFSRTRSSSDKARWRAFYDLSHELGNNCTLQQIESKPWLSQELLAVIRAGVGDQDVDVCFEALNVAVVIIRGNIGRPSKQPYLDILQEALAHDDCDTREEAVRQIYWVLNLKYLSPAQARSLIGVIGESGHRQSFRETLLKTARGNMNAWTGDAHYLDPRLIRYFPLEWREGLSLLHDQQAEGLVRNSPDSVLGYDGELSTWILMDGSSEYYERFVAAICDGLRRRDDSEFFGRDIANAIIFMNRLPLAPVQRVQLVEAIRALVQTLDEDKLLRISDILLPHALERLSTLHDEEGYMDYENHSHSVLESPDKKDDVVAVIDRLVKLVEERHAAESSRKAEMSSWEVVVRTLVGSDRVRADLPNIFEMLRPRFPSRTPYALHAPSPIFDPLATALEWALERRVLGITPNETKMFYELMERYLGGGTRAWARLYCRLRTSLAAAGIEDPFLTAPSRLADQLLCAWHGSYRQLPLSPPEVNFLIYLSVSERLPNDLRQSAWSLIINNN